MPFRQAAGIMPFQSSCCDLGSHEQQRERLGTVDVPEHDGMWSIQDVEVACGALSG